MNFNKYKNISPIYDVLVSKKKGLKKLIISNKRSFGRPFGKIVCWHKGGGVKRKYRILLDKTYLTQPTYAIVQDILYDPNKSAFIGNIQLQNGSFSTISLNSNMKVNDIIRLDCDSTDEISIGDRLKLHYIPLGVPIYNLEQYPGKGASLAKSAGSSCFLVSKSALYARVKLPSGETRLFDLDCSACVGVPSNINHKFQKKYKAGNNRLLNRRPTVRGVAMNPVDHPHGGGEGKTSGGRPSVSPWGKLTKNVPTRSKKKINKLILR